MLVEILAYLPTADMVTVQHICHTIHNIVTGTAYLQYISKVETHLPYRDIVANHLDFGRFESILADREWIVGMTNTVSQFYVNTLGPFDWSLIMHNRRMRGVLFPCIR